MLANERQVRTAAKMYEARDTLRKLSGERFPERVAEYQKFIRGAMAKWKLDVMPATLRLCEGVGEPVTQMWLTAAAVELIENPAEATQ